jgi:hypothetical protein
MALKGQGGSVAGSQLFKDLIEAAPYARKSISSCGVRLRKPIDEAGFHLR